MFDVDQYVNKSWVWQTKKGCAAANGFNDNQNILNVRILKKCDLVANLLPFEYRLALGLSTVLINLLIFRILNKRSPIDHSKCSQLVVIANLVIFSLPFLREFVSTVGWGTWIFTIKICWAKLYVQTFNSELKRRIIWCVQPLFILEGFRHQEVHVSFKARMARFSTRFDIEIIRAVIRQMLPYRLRR